MQEAHSASKPSKHPIVPIWCLWHQKVRGLLFGAADEYFILQR